MAVKPIVKVDVDVSQWDKFQKNYTQYVQNVNTTNNTWNTTNNQIQKFANTLNTINKTSSSTNNIFKTIESISGNIAKNIERATRAFLKWTGISTIISGMLALGGMFNLDRIPGFGFGGMAASASSMRNQARGSGATIGELNAARINYGRYYNDPEGLIGKISDAKVDPTKAAFLRYLGIDMNASAFDIERQMGPAIAAKYRELGPIAGTAMQSLGAGDWVSPDEMRRLAATSPEEFKESYNKAERDRKALNLDDKTLKAWQDFLSEIDTAKITIENVFIKALTPLAKPLGDLSDAFANLVKAIGNSPAVAGWIEKVAVGMEHFAIYIGTPEFEKDVEDFANGIKKIGLAIKDFLIWAGFWPSQPTPAVAVAAPGSGVLYGDGDTPTDPSGVGSTRHVIVPKSPNTPQAKAQRDFLAKLGNQSGLPDNLLWEVYGIESSFGANSGKSPAGADGPFQFMPGTWADPHIGAGGDVHNFEQSAQAAGRYLSYLRNKFAGFAAKNGSSTAELALAAYNWGEGNLQKDIDKHPNDWKDYLPPETKDYLAKYILMERDLGERQRANDRFYGGLAYSGSGGTTVTINNQAGADLNVTTHRAALP